MATKEQAAAEEARLLSALGDIPEKFVFLIPGWPAQDSQRALTWMRHMLWEGFYVAYEVDRKARRVYLKHWEFGDEEPAWDALEYDT